MFQKLSDAFVIIKLSKLRYWHFNAPFIQGHHLFQNPILRATLIRITAIQIFPASIFGFQFTCQYFHDEARYNKIGQQDQIFARF